MLAGRPMDRGPGRADHQWVPRPRWIVALLALAVALLAAAPAHAARGAGGFELVFGSVKRADRPAVRDLRRSHVLQTLVATVNRRYRLPNEVPILVSDEADVGPAYIPRLRIQGRRISLINVPGSFVELELQALGELFDGSDSITPSEAMIGSSAFVVAHEMGHALVHQLDIPVTGREEDAVDGFAAYTLVDDPRFGPLSAVSAAAFFDVLAAENGPLTDADFADEHSILQQRVYQFVCWVYGSDPHRYRSLVAADLLPKERAARCPAEWHQLNHSWSRLLAPYARRR